MMSHSEYKEIIDFIDNRAKKIVIDKVSIHPHAFLVRKTGDVGIELLMFPFHPDKAEEELSILASDFGPECIVTVSEGWSSQETDLGKPSEKADRKEVLFLNSEHIEHEMVFIMNEIKRKDNGRIKALVRDSVTDQVTKVKGRLAEFLSKFGSVGSVSSIKRQPGYKAHFSSDKYTLH
jgi:hypothetical protein